MNNKKLRGQSFLDKVIQITGSVTAAIDMAIANGISITDDIEIGAVLNTTKIESKATKYKLRNKQPATDISVDEMNILILWILHYGSWLDEGIWIDNETWKDGEN